MQVQRIQELVCKRRNTESVSWRSDIVPAAVISERGNLYILKSPPFDKPYRPEKVRVGMSPCPSR